jgi:predicted nucleic acid-binding Zn ribbon protein
MRQGAALGRLARAWPQVVGDQLARQTVPQALDEGGLLVAATSAAWGSQVRFLAGEIAARANRELGSDEVRSVRVMVASGRQKRLQRKGYGGVAGQADGAGRGGPGW